MAFANRSDERRLVATGPSVAIIIPSRIIERLGTPFHIESLVAQRKREMFVESKGDPCMKATQRFLVTLTLAIPSLCLLGCPGVPADGTGDSATPAPCTADTDCPDGIACVFADETDAQGFCDVDETQISTGTPAPCNADADCPEGIGCLFPNGTDQAGFCDVDETQAP